MEIYRCYELFLTDRKISGCSEATLRFYEYVIGKLLRFIEENNLGYYYEAGNYTIEWNAEGYPSGVYFVKLDADGFTQTQKLMLVK